MSPRTPTLRRVGSTATVDDVGGYEQFETEKDRLANPSAIPHVQFVERAAPQVERREERARGEDQTDRNHGDPCPFNPPHQQLYPVSHLTPSRREFAPTWSLAPGATALQRNCSQAAATIRCDKPRNVLRSAREP